MDLPTDGASLQLQNGRLNLRVSESWLDGSDGEMTLAVEDAESFDTVEIPLELTPWKAGSYAIHDWSSANVLIVSGAERVVALGLHAPHPLATMGLEYEECETLDRPWITEVAGEALIVATERRVWCLDATPSIRWCWSVQTGPDDRFIYGSPHVESAGVSVPVRSRGGDVVARLRMRDGGLERAR